MTTEASKFSRREFFVRAGVVGAAVVLLETDSLGTTPAGAAVPSSVTWLLDQLASDTVSGLVAFVVPGPDAYSVAQGLSDSVPGGIAADGSHFMVSSLDTFFPVPAEPLRLLVQTLATGLSDKVAIPPGLLNLTLPLELATRLDGLLADLVGFSGSIPLSEVVALLLNFLASIVNPSSIVGPFLSPFSNLTFAERSPRCSHCSRRTLSPLPRWSTVSCPSR